MFRTLRMRSCSYLMASSCWLFLLHATSIRPHGKHDLGTLGRAASVALARRGLQNESFNAAPAASNEANMNVYGYTNAPPFLRANRTFEWVRRRCVGKASQTTPSQARLHLYTLSFLPPPALSPARPSTSRKGSGWGEKQ
ncbi:hypothetical protein BKA70DRAFT_1263715 [Coprinopsis sp. MPI-PUGE-AT-0042]|nr:hypothetical protein BKA70DRAFT_1263715 [Coprinopsis sp. MPI-PUGE-AT-0042]